jgi:hypothetical protein
LEIEKEDITVLLQGPLKNIDIENIKKSYGDYKIILSTWEGEEIENIDFAEKIIVQPFPPQIDYGQRPDLLRFKGSNIEFQVLSTAAGLRHIETKYVVKARTDEYYNLDELIKVFGKDTDKIVSINFIARRFSYAPYHVSDHLFIGETETILRSLLSIVKHLYFDADFPLIKVFGSTEQFIGLSYIKNKTGFYEETKELQKKFFEIIEVEKLSPFLCRWNHNGSKVYTQDNIKDFYKNYRDNEKGVLQKVCKNNKEFLL